MSLFPIINVINIRFYYIRITRIKYRSRLLFKTENALEVEVFECAFILKLVCITCESELIVKLNFTTENEIIYVKKEEEDRRTFRTYTHAVRTSSVCNFQKRHIFPWAKLFIYVPIS